MEAISLGLITVLAGSAGYSLAKAWGLPLVPWQASAAALLIAAHAAVAVHRPRVGRALALLYGLGAGLALARLPALRNWALAAARGSVALVRELRAGDLNSVNPPAGYVVLAMLALSYTLWAVSLDRRRRSLLGPVLAGLLLFGAEWLYYFDPAYRHLLLYLPAALFLLGPLRLAQTAGNEAGPGRGDKGRGDKSRAEFSRPVLAAGVFLLTASLGAASLLPSDLKAVQLGSVAPKITRVLPGLSRWRGASGLGDALRNRFDLARTGFAPGSVGELGGPVTLDTAPALEVEARSPDLPPVIYLRGSVGTTYTGRGWLPGEDAFERRDSDTPLSPAGAIGDAQRLDLVVRPLGPALTTLFSPWRPARVSLGEAYLYHNQAGVLLALTPYGHGRSYRVEADVPRPEAGASPGGGRPTPGGTPSSEPALSPYLALPPDLPARVGELAHRVAGAEPTPSAQALAVEQYLRRFPYSLTPPPTPPGRDLVDYFLFDLQRGYCTYYSSAMVVMLRSLGIPARWVNGYRLPLDGRHGNYQVLNSQAHAWPEVYLPGSGWLTFEPTPAFASPSRGWSAPSAGEAGEYSGAGLPPAAGRPHASRDLPEEKDLAVDRGAPPPAWPVVLAGGTAAGVLLALLLLARQSERVALREPRTAIRRLYRNAARLLRRSGLLAPAHLTPAEVLGLAARRWPELTGSLRGLEGSYYRARYAGSEPDPSDLDAALTAWLEVRRFMLRHGGWFRYHLRLVLDWLLTGPVNGIPADVPGRPPG